MQGWCCLWPSIRGMLWWSVTWAAEVCFYSDSVNVSCKSHMHAGRDCAAWCHTTKAAPCGKFCSHFRSVDFGGWGFVSGNCHLTTVVNTVSALERAFWFIKRCRATSWAVLSSPWTGGGRLTFQITIEQDGIHSMTQGLVSSWVRSSTLTSGYVVCCRWVLDTSWSWYSVCSWFCLSESWYLLQGKAQEKKMCF